MTTEIFEGSPEALATYIAGLGATTIHHVVLTHVKGAYLIIYS